VIEHLLVDRLLRPDTGIGGGVRGPMLQAMTAVLAISISLVTSPGPQKETLSREILPFIRVDPNIRKQPWREK
jgi:hypothetical protein